ncbi:hypothetical protein [Shimazuella kribbensis]|uniref:hypothetical protein n=1 Tax=Shimazuella kribbensis TaxID=139808 RepID=UPI00041F53B0|nr:hypothetical protein [Shimazuella kribbensis]
MNLDDLDDKQQQVLEAGVAKILAHASNRKEIRDYYMNKAMSLYNAMATKAAKMGLSYTLHYGYLPKPRDAYEKALESLPN